VCTSPAELMPVAPIKSIFVVENGGIDCKISSVFGDLKGRFRPHYPQMNFLFFK
jgi:hypothetical protein